MNVEGRARFRHHSVIAAIAAPELADALCSGRHAAFDPQGDGETATAAADRHAAAVEMCGWCSAQPRCRAWVDSLPPRQKPLGVIAGQIRT